MEHVDRIIEALRTGKRTVPQYFEYEDVPLNEMEWLRYACIPIRDQQVVKEDSKFTASMAKALAFAREECVFRLGFIATPISCGEDGFPVLPFAQKSEKLKNNLEDCSAVVLFAATVGSGMDRMIRRFEKSDPQMGLLLQGLGAERVESLCDLFNAEVDAAAQSLGYSTCHRYSPGYGDLPIEVQKEFLPLLDAERRLGILLSDSYLMAPSKSVTAIIGIR